ncbi:A/G-specific adenine glycosylase [Subsaxibacter sp. CAU 1640]|uniref:A/G-specific adenine glycosylase n=1 Tax=Subsaxibacter sp. CAU 1640 TaxID=2933271 RepID=UPI0020065187|nr:A/G-specific adenine glycosylase [Subsaxibacter sp. CAU 1640]MCK7589740.1 A/G-specific adenine glycosylase [Subsaxibacter sp. CAU 1640]
MNFSKILTYWYSEFKRDFPWRNTKEPYFIWLSEIIMQQTQTKQGLPYYEAFVTKFPTVFGLAKAQESEVLKLWQGLGYYSRARNLHFTAKYVVDELNGVFPNQYKDLIKLKGIGDYTASAIASICYNEPTAVVDGNVYRVLSRYFGISTPINSSEGIKEFKALATSLIDKDNPGDYNQAIMEFGATQCKPQNPDCNVCPLISNCVAFNKNLVKELPVKLKKTKVSTKYFNFLVFISADGKTLFEKRTSKGIWQNLYQFPLLETKSPLTIDTFKNHPYIKEYLKGSSFKYSLYNDMDVIHKLSHQHLHTKFWIVEIEKLPKAGIPFDNLTAHPTSILISNFIDEFDFSAY